MLVRIRKIITIPRLTLGLLSAGTVLGALSIAAFPREPAAAGDDPAPPATTEAGTVAPLAEPRGWDPVPGAEASPTLTAGQQEQAHAAEGAIEAPPEPPAEASAAQTQREQSANGRFRMPLQSGFAVTDRYGAARGGGLIHGGIDLALDGLFRTPVYSSCTGTVTAAAYSYSYGNHVIVDCGEHWGSLYGHFSKLLVAPGDQVTVETVLGISGSSGYSTGEHVHFEIWYAGVRVNPESYLEFHIPPGTPLSSGPLYFPGSRTGDSATPVPATPTPEPTATPRPTNTPTPTATPTLTPTPTPRPPRATPTPKALVR